MEATMGEWISIGPNGNRAYLVQPESGSGPGVLMLHAWWGLNACITDMCDRLASEGFTVLAPDLYPDGATATTIEDAQALAKQHGSEPNDPDGKLVAAAEYLRDLPEATGEQIATVGFSLGAYYALNLSQIRPDDVGAVVVFYGTGDHEFSDAKATYLGHFAANDDFEPLDVVKEQETAIRNAGHDVTFHIYPDTGHWFCEPDRTDAYAPEAAELAWDRTLQFLRAETG
jgi:carboxymethylenebutenolidase